MPVGIKEISVLAAIAAITATLIVSTVGIQTAYAQGRPEGCEGNPHSGPTRGGGNPHHPPVDKGNPHFCPPIGR